MECSEAELGQGLGSRDGRLSMAGDYYSRAATLLLASARISGEALTRLIDGSLEGLPTLEGEFAVESLGRIVRF